MNALPFEALRKTQDRSYTHAVLALCILSEVDHFHVQAEIAHWIA